jgi:predicted RNA-binding Zn-ribbon protein involved in translation (DUF1610 family)
MVELYEIRLKCPYCKTETALIVHESNPVMFECPGCDKNVVIQNSIVYTIPRKYFNKLSKKFKTIQCGEIVGYNAANTEVISQKEIDELHKELLGISTVDDFIKKLK